MPTGSEFFVKTLGQLGIGHIFTLVGDHLNEVLVRATEKEIRIIDMRHESGVTHAADAWARLNRQPAISLVTGRPGHTNSLTGIATANLAGSPLNCREWKPDIYGCRSWRFSGYRPGRNFAACCEMGCTAPWPWTNSVLSHARIR